MKIVLFFKSYAIKACYSFVIISMLAGAPLSAKASLFSDLTALVLGTTTVTADETPNPSNSNSQNMDLAISSEPSVNPDLKNANETQDIVIVQGDSYIYSEGLYLPDVKFEKSTISDQILVYTVEKGDTLSQIAEDFGVSMNTIRWENNISGQTISVGQKLNILPMTGVKHIVKSGDTIGGIANKYDADTEDILIFNGIDKGEAIKVRDIIFVPNGIIKTTVVKKSSGSSSSSTTTTSRITVSSGYYLRPVSGRITSNYGSRRGGFHPGVDLGGPGGTPVKAAASGIVTKVVSGCKKGARSCGGRYGNHIVVQHDNGTSTLYAHLSATSVHVGQSVSKGEVIGALGNTGYSTGPHLHFEIRSSNGSTIKPPVY